jgi:dipeptidyl aminopeptidase/acylaminoacyl peptidase
MNADGSSQTRLTNSPGFDISPAWSPDGSRIAFRSSRDGNSEIYVMNADGTIPLRLTDNPAVDSTPQWSPDGTKLAFTSNRDGNFEVYVMNADGTSETRLTDNLAEDVAPAWSPDGTQIAFSSDRDGRQTSGQVTPSDIFVMNAEGTAQTNITRSPTIYDDSPIWQALQGTPPASTTTSTSTSLPPTTTTPTTTTVPSSRTQLSPPLGSRGAVFTATTSGLDPGKNYALFFADSARLASGPCHQVGIKVSGPTLSGGDGSATLSSRVPVNAARGVGQVCFALKNNRANHSDAATFRVL